MKDIPYTSPYLSQIREFKEEEDQPLVAELFLKSQKDPEYLRKLKTFQNNFFPETYFDEPSPNIQNSRETSRLPVVKEIKQKKAEVEFRVWRFLRVAFAAFFWTSFCVIAFLLVFDVRNKINAEMERKRLEIQICQMEFAENRCENPLPALKTFCLEREKCMVTDVHASVMKIKHLALVVTEIINSTIAHCDIKTLIFLTVITFGYLFFEIFFRNKAKKD